MLPKAVLVALASSTLVLAQIVPLPPATPPTTGTPAPPGSISVNQCNTANVQCCQRVTTQTDSEAATLTGLLGIVLEGITGLVGLGCVVGITNCAQQPVCCTNNNFNGLINLGCTPISL